MAGEANLWKYLRDGMRGKWHAQRHEDKFSAGIPDVSYAILGIDGWIELKSMRDWPARADTPVKCGLTPAQALWLKKRGHAGNGRCFILLRAGRDYLLFLYTEADVLMDGAPKDELLKRSVKAWGNGILFDELVGALLQQAGSLTG